VPRDQIDQLYLNSTYYIIPDGEVGAEAFAVIREAISKEGMVAIGKVLFTSREHIIALEARGKGLLGVTLRYPYEVRNEEEYFDDIPEPKITKDMLDLATHIVETRTSEFDPKKFQDQYEDAVKELLKKKQAGETIEAPKERKPANVVNLMEALRQSIAAESGARGKPAARSVQHRKGAKKTTSKPHTRQRRAS
jgi:DNA end-binding protein Ku